MNRRQLRIIRNFVIVTVATIVAAFGMVELKNSVNRSEAIRAMGQLGKVVSDYRQKNGSVPPETYVNELKENLEGQVRVGELQYRARWIEFNSPPDTILAYVRKDYHSLFFRPGVIVLRLDGRIEWMDRTSFDKEFARQQKPLETELTPPTRY